MTAPLWNIDQLAEEIRTALAEGGYEDGNLIEGRALAVKASPERDNSSKIVMGTVALPPDFTTVPHSHESEEVAIVISGSGVVEIDGEPHPMEEGWVLLTPSNAHHVTTSGPDGLVMLWFYAPPGSEVRWLPDED